MKSASREMKILYYLLMFGLALLLALALFALLHWSVFYSLYSWLFGRVVEVTGHDIWLSRAITLSLLAVFWYFSWDFLLVPWFRDKRKRIAILLGVRFMREIERINLLESAERASSFRDGWGSEIAWLRG